MNRHRITGLIILLVSFILYGLTLITNSAQHGFPVSAEPQHERIGRTLIGTHLKIDRP